MFDFIAFMRRKWAEYTDFSGQPGTVVDEMAVKPTALLLGDFYNSLVKQRKVNNISEWRGMTEEELDFFGNKFFIPRIAGDYSVGTVRIWFNGKYKFVIDENSMVVNSEGLMFRFAQPGNITAGMYRDSSDGVAPYYIDFSVIATNPGSSYDTDIAGVSQVTGISASYVRVSNLERISGGYDREDNSQYYKRLLLSVHDRSMLNERGVLASIRQNFPRVISSYVCSSGDKYMKRDIVYGISGSNQSAIVGDFRGKTKGNLKVPHILFRGVFPNEMGDQNSYIYGPHSITSSDKFWRTIDPIADTFSASTDPALLGYPTNQEVDDESYKGIYFDDVSEAASMSTKKLFDIEDREYDTEPVLPDSLQWLYGAHGKSNGDFGPLTGDIGAVDVISIENSTIKLCGGCSLPISIQRDIQKRTGVTVRGTFIWPAVANENSSTLDSNLQVSIGGGDKGYIDAYSGFGFGVRVVAPYDVNENENAILYIAHSSGYENVNVYMNQGDLGELGVVSMYAIAEKSIYIQPGVEYEFELTVGDLAEIKVFLSKMTDRSEFDSNGTINDMRISTPSNALVSFCGINGILSNSAENYGTLAKITLDTRSVDCEEEWIVNGFKCLDTNRRTQTALVAIGVDGVDFPISVSARVYGEGATPEYRGEGYDAYIWDKTLPSSALNSELASGGWVRLPELSNHDGSKDVLSSAQSATIDDGDRYAVKSRFGSNVYIMFVSSGTSRVFSKYDGEISDDIESSLHIDYISISGENSRSIHSCNMSDLYVVTASNQRQQQNVYNTVSKMPGTPYFRLNSDSGFVMPIMEIVSVVPGTNIGGNAIDSSEIRVIGNTNMIDSSSPLENVDLYINNQSINQITVAYNSYPDIARINDFFNESSCKRIVGNILVKHKFPVYLEINVFFTGPLSQNGLVSEILKYVDNNIDGTFVVSQMVSHLYNIGAVNNIREPLQISYTGIESSGVFSDRLSIRPVEFFKVAKVSVERL